MAYAPSTMPQVRPHLASLTRAGNDNAAAKKPERTAARISRLPAGERMALYRVIARMVTSGHPRAVDAFDLAFDRVPVEAS